MDDDIPGCCVIPEAIEARTIEIGRDRRAFSRRFITAGEVILRNHPTAHTLFYEHRRERCAHCMSTTRRQQRNKSLLDFKFSLLRCGGCKQTWYCSRICQKMDLGQHRVECKEAPILLSSVDQNNNLRSRSDTPSNEVSYNAALLVRNFLALRLKKGKTSNSNCCQHCSDSVTVQCGIDHFEKLAQYNGGTLEDQEMVDILHAEQALWNQRTALNKILHDVINDRSKLKDQLERDIRRFRINNFGVTNCLVHVIAGAVYPLGALLNHSCSPNCLLRYDFSSESSRCHKPPVMEIIAAQDIPRGKELTHSYVELVSSTTSRISNLRDMYGFDCHCPRCCRNDVNDITSINNINEFRIWLPKKYRSLSSTELTRWILLNYNPAISNEMLTNLTKDESHLISFDQEFFLQPLNKNKTTIEAIKIKQQQAKYFMMNGDLKNELSSLKEVVQILESLVSASEELLPLSLELYQARCDRLGSLIVAGRQDNSIEALIECEHIVSFLCLALNHFPNHSLLGLQLFTLGDLYDADGEGDKAQDTYIWARRTLQISQGHNSEMVILLNEKIVE